MGALTRDLIGLGGDWELFKMDDSTQQLLEALEQRVRLQLKPIERRQDEILDELKARRDQVQTLETQTALSNDRIKRYEEDLTNALSAIRRDVAYKHKVLEEKIDDSHKRFAPLLAAVPGILALLLGLAVYWLRT